jgi:hypothetical protein
VAAGGKDRNLDALLRDPGFSPAARDLPALVERLEAADELAELAERALARLGQGAVPALLRATLDAGPSTRARTARLLGRIAPEHAEARARLVSLLGDAESRVRRFSARALGRSTHEEARAALVDAWHRASLPEDKRAIAAALGKVGGEQAKAALAAARAEDPELARVVGRSRLVLSRDEARAVGTTIDASAAADRDLELVFRCRRGLEALVATELGSSWNARAFQPGLVRATLRGPLERAFASRIAVSFAIALPPARSTGDLAADVSGVLASSEARGLFARFTRGPIRFRLDFGYGGHHHALI